MFGKSGKREREFAARIIRRCGVAWLASKLPATDSLLILTYHRIGNSAETQFDPGVYSATADEFHDQISYLKKTASVVSLDEALAFLLGTEKSSSPRCRVLVTFDDGCIDNYTVAFPILRSLNVQGLFFLISGMVGTNSIPWWDRIAYILRTARKSKFSLSYPGHLAVNITRAGYAAALGRVLYHYKRPDNLDGDRFIAELSEACKGSEPPTSLRIFLNWEEAREMTAGGMAVGSHTHTHTVLSQLPLERQFDEMMQSRAILRRQLQTPIDTIAYPVGSRTAFTDDTRRLARQAGYRAAFAFHGGSNIPGRIAPYELARSYVGSPTLARFRTQSAIGKCTGYFWP